MGNSSSQVGVNRLSTDGAPRFKPPREQKRFGCVTLKVHTINARNAEDQVSHVLTPKGALLYGSLFNPGVVLKAMEGASYPLIPPAELMIPDSRAHKLLITYVQGWHLVPFPEVFSRHSGTCVIVGDRNTPTLSYSVKVGDCFRLGSVGVVVSELKLEGEEEEKLDNRTLQFLKDEALAFDTSEDLAGLASDEMGGECSACLSGKGHKGTTDEDERTEPNYQAGLTNGEKFICYMCYETHNTFEDPLIAPCECKGDTRFLHVQCLQKWYYSSAQGSRAQVIRTTGNGAPACKICGTAYKTNFKRQDGRKASILEMENNGPYLSLVVVTHHDTNPGLFNTKFRLNFGRRANAPPHLTDEELNTIVIGRSSSCNMILDYRTVSTIHAKIAYENGQFVLTDNRSSNGTMVYLQRPFPLPYSQSTKLRMGRTTLTVMAKRSWTAALRSYLSGSNRNRAGAGANQPPPGASMDASEHQATVFDATLPTPVYIHDLLCALPISPQEKNEGRNDSADHEFLHARSYTIRTLNDASAEGMDFDRDVFNPGMYGNMPNMAPHMMPGALFPTTQSNLNFTMNINAPSGQAMLYLNHHNSNGTFDIESHNPTRLFNQMNAALRPGQHGAVLTSNTLIADAGQGGMATAGQGYDNFAYTQDDVDLEESRQTHVMGMRVGMSGAEREGDRESVEEWLTSPQPTEGPAHKADLAGQELEETQLSLPPLLMTGKRSGAETPSISESKTEEQANLSSRVGSPQSKVIKQSTIVHLDSLHQMPDPNLSQQPPIHTNPSPQTVLSREEEVLLLRPAATAFANYAINVGAVRIGAMSASENVVADVRVEENGQAPADSGVQGKENGHLI